MLNTNNDWPPQRRDDGGNWSEAQLTILRLLWPMEWVDRRVILEEVGQSYYDRRIRELRESGWQIETNVAGRNYFYRLVSHEKGPGSRREYPTVTIKRQLLRRQNSCQICGETDNLQIDHKVPRERGGHTELENLQLLCSFCNVEKRGICKKCELTTCDECPYAYPELNSGRMILFIDPSIVEEIDKLSQEFGQSRTQFVRNVLAEYISKRNAIS